MSALRLVVQGLPGQGMATQRELNALGWAGPPGLAKRRAACDTDCDTPPLCSEELTASRASAHQGKVRCTPDPAPRGPSGAAQRFLKQSGSLSRKAPRARGWSGVPGQVQGSARLFPRVRPSSASCTVLHGIGVSMSHQRSREAYSSTPGRRQSMLAVKGK